MIIDYVPASVSADVLICAIHAGMEIGTGDIARAVHAHCPAKAGLYVCYTDKHITSHQFNEPLFNAIVGRYKRVISIHGMGASDPIAWIGGRDKALVRQLRSALGLDTSQRPPSPLRGEHLMNVVNRGTTGRGVQVEVAWIHLDPKSPLRSWIAKTVGETLLNC